MGRANIAVLAVMFVFRQDGASSDCTEFSIVRLIVVSLPERRLLAGT